MLLYASLSSDATQLFSNKAKSLQLFQKDRFDTEAFINAQFRGLSEKGIEGAAKELDLLTDYCSQEVGQKVGRFTVSGSGLYRSSRFRGLHLRKPWRASGRGFPLMGSGGRIFACESSASAHSGF